jgi:hypothetical protein
LKIAESNVPIEYMMYKDRTLEFVKPQGNTAVVRFNLREKKNIPMQYLEPVAPDMERTLVTVISGDRMGKIFRVLTYSAHECKLRDISIHPIRKKDDFMIETQNLVQVYPSK